eukprot:GHUV01015357.1.p1 GENE.GHUV01015357.1~~GHUV01015357.1.p1  ORF type:complete len:176 (-),score=15.55 GHUV01015357.1:377-904(-)
MCVGDQHSLIRQGNQPGTTHNANSVCRKASALHGIKFTHCISAIYPLAMVGSTADIQPNLPVSKVNHIQYTRGVYLVNMLTTSQHSSTPHSNHKPIIIMHPQYRPGAPDGTSSRSSILLPSAEAVPTEETLSVYTSIHQTQCGTTAHHWLPAEGPKDTISIGTSPATGQVHDMCT